MTYADSSCLVSLLSSEPGSEEVVSAYRRLGRPRLAYTPLHEIEVRNGLRLKAFMEKASVSAARKAGVDREFAAWEARLLRYLKIGTLVPVAANWHEATERAQQLSATHTRKLGTRTYDILHVAFALEMNCSTFMTIDLRQAALAKAAGLKVVLCK